MANCKKGAVLKENAFCLGFHGFPDFTVQKTEIADFCDYLSLLRAVLNEGKRISDLFDLFVCSHPFRPRENGTKSSETFMVRGKPWNKTKVQTSTKDYLVLSSSTFQPPWG